ncbi:PEP-CTERM sorting domain-containing protein [Microcystis aeruginosa]|uniref:Ice-binding protein C-terminal domain-containing protein n=1 Tax=Microcystis aeruginosa NIES-2521 TaxID=2303983 RepID=A0A5A5S9Z1_MICAE|nr:PEP-CTERM sorting domain-containing protein [Microcystis aeruginosa]GCA81376.1 hypothetical protein MiTs_03391 [Microcystis aeruginosa NIES-2521]
MKVCKKTSKLLGLISGVTLATSGMIFVHSNPANAVPATSPVSVPEPSSIIGLAVLGTLGGALTLKRQIKSSKPSEQETPKVG